MVVNKSSLIEDIWRLFYNRLKANVTATTLTGSTVTPTIQTYESNFSDRPFSDNTYYPVLVVSTPNVPTEFATLGKEKVDGSIEIDVYTFQAESADKFVSQILNSIETYKGTLATNGLRRLRVESVDSDMAIRGTIKIHVRRIRFSFRYFYAKTKAF